LPPFLRVTSCVSSAFVHFDIILSFLALSHIVKFFLTVEDEPEEAFSLCAGDVIHGGIVALASGWGEEVPSDRHGFVRELFFSDFELYVLLPGIAFHCWGSGFDDVFFLWEDAIHLGGVCVLVFLEVVSHCRYLNYNNGI
jgi:hypothetical protein